MLVVYGNTLANKFAFDDEQLLLKNTAVHGISLDNVITVFTSAPNGIEYLPVRDLTLMLDYSIMGLNPLIYHFSNVIYYLLFCLMLYKVLTKLLPCWTDNAETIAFVSAAIFAVHPVHVEAVAGIAQRKDLIFGIFLALAVLSYLKHVETGSKFQYALALAFTLLSLLSKATAVIIAPLILAISLYTATGGKEEMLRKAIHTAPFFAITAAISLLHVLIYNSSGVIKPYNYGLDSQYYVRLLTAFKSIAFYLKLLFVPYPLTVKHDLDFTETIDPAAVGFIILALVLLCLAVYLYKRDRAVSFFISWFFISIFPAIGLIPTSELVAERHLLVPSVSASVIFALVVNRHLSMDGPRRAAVLIITLSVLVTFATISFKRK